MQLAIFIFFVLIHLPKPTFAQNWCEPGHLETMNLYKTIREKMMYDVEKSSISAFKEAINEIENSIELNSSHEIEKVAGIYLPHTITTSQLNDAIKSYNVGFQNLSDMKNSDPFLFIHTGMLSALGIQKAVRSYRGISIIDDTLGVLAYYIPRLANFHDEYLKLFSEGGWSPQEAKVASDQIKRLYALKDYRGLAEHVNKILVHLERIVNIGLARVSAEGYNLLPPLSGRLKAVSIYADTLAVIQRAGGVIKQSAILTLRINALIFARTVMRLGGILDVASILTGGLTCNPQGLFATFRSCMGIKIKVDQSDISGILSLSENDLLNESQMACKAYYYDDVPYRTARAESSKSTNEQRLLPGCHMSGIFGYFKSDEFYKTIKDNFKSAVLNFIIHRSEMKLYIGR